MRHVFNKVADIATKSVSGLKKVQFNKIDDIEDELSRVYSGEFVQDALDEAEKQFILARDIVRFDMNDALMNAEALIDDLEADLKELGVDDSNDVKELKARLEDARQEVEEYEMKVDRFLR